MEWEREFLKSTSANMDMMLGAFVDVYFRDKAGELKERTIKNKRYMIEAYVLPYFENKQMNEISPSDIIQWQNAIRAKGYSQAAIKIHERFEIDNKNFGQKNDRSFDKKEL